MLNAQLVGKLKELLGYKSLQVVLLIRKANITSLGVKFKINNFELQITHLY